MTAPNGAALELTDIQAAALCPRPTPYAGAYLGIRIDEPRAGRQLLRRLLPRVDSVASFEPARQTSLGVALTFPGLQALGVPEDSLASFPAEFQQGMAARAADLGDTGASAPENWEEPLGSSALHLILASLAPDEAALQDLSVLIDDALGDLPGAAPIWRQQVHVGPDEREPFGFRDGIGQPAIEGSGIPGTNPYEQPVKAGEFILGYQNETGGIPRIPQPEVLGRNGTYASFRKLHTRVAAFRRYLHERAASREEEQLLAAKFVGRWPSGAPLALSPEIDDPDLGADPERNNAFMYGDDPLGLKCPLGAHARRMNARDGRITGQPRLHRMIRRGTTYGPPLAPGSVDDDGVDRGIIFTFICANLARQFEFVQTEWVNDGNFAGVSGEMDPLVGPNDDGVFTLPKKPIRRRFSGLPPFVINRGGEYGFVPGLRGLRWLSELDD